jgi:hypothetical protein
MPSIQDVADQINARLDAINTNTANTAQNTLDIRNALGQTNALLGNIDATLGAGFANLSQGLFALLQVQLAALALLNHNRLQNDTMICQLAAADKLLCEIMRELAHQLRLSEAELRSLLRIEGISERAHCCEAGDYDRTLEMKNKMLECCPPKPIPEEPCPDLCRVPVFQDRQLPATDWKPLPTPPRNQVG